MSATELIKSLSIRVDRLEKQYDLFLQQFFVLTSSSTNNSQFRSVSPPPATFLHSQSAAAFILADSAQTLQSRTSSTTSSIPSHLPFTPSDGAPVPSLPITHGAVPVPSLEMDSSPRHPPKADPQISECLLDPDDVIKRYPKLLNLSCIG